MAEHSEANQNSDWIAPVLKDNAFTKIESVVLSVTAVSNLTIIANDKIYMSYDQLEEQAKIPYVRLCATIATQFNINIAPCVFRDLIFYIDTTIEVKNFWNKLMEYAPHISAKTKFLVPPINSCIECGSCLSIRDVLMLPCLTKESEPDVFVCEVILRCRKSSCSRGYARGLSVGYSYYIDKNKAPVYWAPDVEGPDRDVIYSVHVQENRFKPNYFRYGQTFYKWDLFTWMLVDKVNGKNSYSAIARSMKIKQYAKMVDEKKTSDPDLYGHAKGKFDSRKLSDAYVVWRCVWYQLIKGGKEVKIYGHNPMAIKKLLQECWVEQSLFVKNYYLNHKTDIYGCWGRKYGDHGIRSPQIVSDGLQQIQVRICATFPRYFGEECWGSPPGRGNRAFCDEPNCLKNEHRCRAYNKKTREPCKDLSIGPLFFHCDKHDEYIIGCANCTEIVIPENGFCNKHHVFKEEYEHKLAKNKKYFHIKKKEQRKGKKRDHRRSRHCMDNEKEDEDEYPDEDAFHCGRVYTKGWISIVCTCGINYWIAPMLRSERVKQHLDMIIEVFGDALKRKHYHWFDLSCKALLEIMKTPKYSMAFAHTKSIVDRYHGFFKHNQKDPEWILNDFCLKYCDVSTMSKEKLQEKYPELIDDDGNNLVNSEAAEQFMNVLGGYKHMMFNQYFSKQRFEMVWLMWDLNQFKMLERHNKVAQWPAPSWPY
eukprot:463602_1